jgi:uncharacterized RmlC-like cupin family protein
MAAPSPAIRVVSPEAFDLGATPTPGFERPAAISPQLGVASSMWAGLFIVEPGARTGVHHHGEQETIAYVISGVSEVRWGPHGEHSATVKSGDFMHIPAFLPHMEINPSTTEPFRWVIVRNQSATTVVNLPDEVCLGVAGSHAPSGTE